MCYRAASSVAVITYYSLSLSPKSQPSPSVYPKTSSVESYLTGDLAHHCHFYTRGRPGLFLGRPCRSTALRPALFIARGPIRRIS
jgi:hypothetical protein